MFSLNALQRGRQNFHEALLRTCNSIVTLWCHDHGVGAGASVKHEETEDEGHRERQTVKDGRKNV